MSRSEARLLTAFVVVGLALTAAAAALALVGVPDDRAAAPPLAPAPATSRPADAATMPELWRKEVNDARAKIAALGFTARVMPMNPEGITDPKKWVVAGQFPQPGTPLKSSVPIFLQVVPKETASRHRGP
ncbi:PASTA domain-containing protein [Nonomuraea jiangxiensis]|uniref:PASTA domain-containing protein n=1 Tax=Nonomuraea jiangxiensis TaxID=633440 RepID=A0A1G8TTD5_9ACTN|nr:PASTA domain-containing protein [Nonomuraea jiangxiensis]SDJ44788.1 hypothetical protein SAMN05421869_110280 [Nonomuraea jiangxiensis]